jgi:hypothetical protein
MKHKTGKRRNGGKPKKTLDEIGNVQHGAGLLGAVVMPIFAHTASSIEMSLSGNKRFSNFDETQPQCAAADSAM